MNRQKKTNHFKGTYEYRTSDVLVIQVNAKILVRVINKIFQGVGLQKKENLKSSDIVNQKMPFLYLGPLKTESPGNRKLRRHI